MSDGSAFSEIKALVTSRDRLVVLFSVQVAERRRQRPAAGHHPENLQLQPQPGAADLPHGDGVHEEESSGRSDGPLHSTAIFKPAQQ